MYNRGLTITTKVDVAMCLIKPMTRGTMKRISEPVESNESESDFDMSETEETHADADEDHDYVPRPAKKLCCNLAHSSIGSNDKSASEPEETNDADDVTMPAKKIRSTLAPSSIGSNDKSTNLNPIGGSSKRFQSKKSDAKGKGVKNKWLKSVVHTQEDNSDCESIFQDDDFGSNAGADLDHDYAPRPVKKIQSTLAPSSIGSNEKSTIGNPLGGSSKKFQFKKLDSNGKVIKKKMPNSVVHTQEDISDCESIFEDEDFGSNKSTKSMKFDKKFKSVVHTQDNLSDVETKIDVFKGKEPKKVYTVVHTQEENMVDVQKIMEENDFGIEEKENQAPHQGGSNKIQFVSPNQQINYDGSLMDFFKRQQQLQMASEISRRTEQTTVQMLVQATLKNQEEAKKREEKLLALLERRS